MTTINKGSCHCGKISFEVEGGFDSILECNCLYCLRKGFLLRFVPKGKFTLKTPESNIATYTFNKHVIKHHFCSMCGCAPFGFGTDPKSGAATVAVNIRCLEGVDLGAVKRIPFDGKSM